MSAKTFEEQAIEIAAKQTCGYWPADRRGQDLLRFAVHQTERLLEADALLAMLVNAKSEYEECLSSVVYEDIDCMAHFVKKARCLASESDEFLNRERVE